MAKEQLVVRFDLKGDKELEIPFSGKAAAEEELKDSFQITWLPDRVEGGFGARSRGLRAPAGFALETVLWIGVGLALSSVVKPFVEGAAGEAGKDFWSGIKKFVGKLWKTQAERQYRYRNVTRIVFDDRQGPLMVLEFFSPFIEKDQEDDGALQTRLDGVFMSLKAGYPSLESRISSKLADLQDLPEKRPVILIKLSEAGQSVARLNSLAEIGGREIFVETAQNTGN